jgi:hypothetical protein
VTVRLLFGHQSVGANLLDGLQELGRAGTPVPGLVDASSQTCPTHGPFIAHFRVGQNGSAESKLRHFGEMLQGSLGRQVDVALFKFCYVDINDDTAAARLFEEYARVMAALQQRFPHLVIGHVTVPLRTTPVGLRAAARRLLGRPAHPELARNRARHAFNQSLRRRFGAGETLFDLAGVEAGGVDASAAPRLRAAYSSDGGHLNATGRAVLAKAFLTFFGSLRPAAAA